MPLRLTDALIRSLTADRSRIEVRDATVARVEIVPRLGKRAAANSTKSEVRDWAEMIARRSHYTANRVFEVLRRAYTWGRSDEAIWPRRPSLAW